MNQETKIKTLREILQPLYAKENSRLLFHGWHHIEFIRKKALTFAKDIKADLFLVEASALIYDWNVFMGKNPNQNDARNRQILTLKDSHLSIDETEKIMRILEDAHALRKTQSISKEAMALSDADRLFKSLPITPIIFASKYIEENKVDIYKLARKVTSEQNPLMEKGVYFYTDIAKKKYLKWAKSCLGLWNEVQDCLDDQDVKDLLAEYNQYIKL